MLALGYLRTFFAVVCLIFRLVPRNALGFPPG
jgi:hypothetical protein